MHEQPSAPVAVGIKITSVDPDTIIIGSNNVQITINGAHTSSVNINGYINPPTTIPQGTVFSP